MSQFVHRYIPPRGDSQRTLLLFHGTGGNEDDLLPLGAELDSECGLLSPRGRILENGMPRFFRRLAMGVFDQDDLRVQTEAMVEFVQESAVAYGFDPGKVIAVGYSNGANLASSMLIRHPNSLQAAALLHGMIPFVPPIAPNLEGKPILLTAGEQDPIVSPEETTQLHSMLHRYGAEIETAWFRHGHSLSTSEVLAVSSWLSTLPS